MFLFELLFVSIIHLVMIGLDVVGFFIVIRVLVFRWPASSLLALDRIGQPVTDPLIESVTRAIPCDWIDDDQRRRLIVAAATMLVVALSRLVLAGLIT